MRNLEREIANICRKTARRVAEGKLIRHSVTPLAVTRFLGPPRFDYGVAEEKDQIGVATGVALTEAGGDLQPVEVTLMDGKGVLMLTGQLGEVMQESAQAAVSYTRSHAQALGLNPQVFEKTDIHIHVPEGARAQRRPLGGRDDCGGARQRVHAAARSARRGDDGRDHAARARAAHRRPERKSAGRAPRRIEDHDPAQEEQERHGRNSQARPTGLDVCAGRAG